MRSAESCQAPKHSSQEKKPPGWGVQLQCSIYLRLTRVAGQIWGDAKVLGAPVAKVFEDWDQCLAGGAERVGDLRRRGAHCPSVDDTIPFHGSHPPVLQNVVSTCPFTLCRLNKFIETS